MTTDRPIDGAAPFGGEPSEIGFLANGHNCVLSVEAAGDPSIPSVFLIGLPKAGSTLLAQLMRPITSAAGLTFVALQQTLRSLGVPPQHIPPEVNRAFGPTGFAFGGFRALPGALALPPYAADRTILLVRDPRDMLTSLFFSTAYSHRPPGGGAGGALLTTFEKRRQEATDMNIDQFVLARVQSVANQFRVLSKKLVGISHKTYRYEDIIFSKLVWAESMISYLNLSVPPGLLQNAVEANDVLPDHEDETQHVRRVKPGDHIEKLRSNTIAELNIRLAPILKLLNYE